MTQLRVREAAVFLGVSEDTVRRWIEKGTLEAGADESGR
jgi:excisionase family DNA binding protein